MTLKKIVKNMLMKNLVKNFYEKAIFKVKTSVPLDRQ
jgi:hypothetical protein